MWLVLSNNMCTMPKEHLKGIVMRSLLLFFFSVKLNQPPTTLKKVCHHKNPSCEAEWKEWEVNAARTRGLRKHKHRAIFSEAEAGAGSRGDAVKRRPECQAVAHLVTPPPLKRHRTNSLWRLLGKRRMCPAVNSNKNLCMTYSTRSMTWRIEEDESNLHISLAWALLTSCLVFSRCWGALTTDHCKVQKESRFIFCVWSLSDRTGMLEIKWATTDLWSWSWSSRLFTSQAFHLIPRVWKWNNLFVRKCDFILV